MEELDGVGNLAAQEMAKMQATTGITKMGSTTGTVA